MSILIQSNSVRCEYDYNYPKNMWETISLNPNKLSSTSLTSLKLQKLSIKKDLNPALSKRTIPKFWDEAYLN